MAAKVVLPSKQTEPAASHAPTRQSADLLIPFILMLPLCLAFLPGGLPNTADGPVHFVRAAEMIHAWQDGLLLPRWAENLGHGYGIPLFVYAPPLPYLLTALFHTIGLSTEVAFKLMLLSGVVSASYGAYHSGRVLLGRMAGAVAATAFLYAPILLRELFIQGNAAQFLAWCCAPWAAYGILQIFRQQPRQGSSALALAVAATMLCHNAAALLLAGMVGWLTLVLWILTRNHRALFSALGGSLLGLALSAWFWAPALLEGSYVRLDRIVASDFRPRFIPIADLLAWPPRLDTGSINPFVPLTLGAAQVALAAVGVVLWLILVLQAQSRFAPKNQSRQLLSYAAGAAWIPFTIFCGFMATRYSEPFWTRLPFVDLFEWPFRWHGFTALGLSWLAAFAVAGSDELFNRLRTRRQLYSGAAAVLLLLAAALVNLYPQKLAPETLHSSPAEVVAFEARTGTIGTTSLGEFDPIWTNGTLAQLPVPPEYRHEQMPNRLPDQLPPGATASHERINVQQHRFHLQLPAPATLTLKLLYFPGWQATLDDTPLPLRPDPDQGLIQVDLPAGEHTLSLAFGETPLRRWGDAISMLAWIGFILLAGARFIRHVRRGQARARLAFTPDDAVSVRATTAVLGLCTLGVIAVYLALPGWFQVHTLSTASPDLAMPLNVDFGDEVALLGADATPSLATVGETISLVTYWRALQRLDVDYAIFAHLDDPSGKTVAAVNYRHPNDIPTSTWSPRLYVRAPMRLTIPENIAPIRYQLRVGMLDRRDGAWLTPFTQVDGRTTQIADDVVEIGQLWVDTGQPVQTPAGPRANFGPTIELLGVRYKAGPGRATLYWRTGAPVGHDYTIFVHALDANGAQIGQIDAAPYDNLYPTSAWRAAQVIMDVRQLGAVVTDPSQIRRLAIGLYDPATGARLAAQDESGQPLADNMLRLDVAARQDTLP